MNYYIIIINYILHYQDFIFLVIFLLVGYIFTFIILLYLSQNTSILISRN